MKRALPIFFLFFSSCFLFEDEQNTKLSLSLHSAGVTTVNLNVSPEDSLVEFTFELTRDDSIVQSLSIQSDTIIKDIGLNPNTSYTYKGYWMNGTERIGESETLTITTMDTTSHNLTWEVDTLGEYGSILHDAVVVNENNIWVVGRIITDSNNYNAAHWDGEEWKYIKVMEPGGWTPYVKCVYYFAEDNIWFGRGGLPVKWNGEEFYIFTPANGEHPGQPSIDAIWGSSPDDIYFVGMEGSIVHYNGTIFERVATWLPEIDLMSVSGNEDGSAVFITGWNLWGDGKSMVVEIINGEVNILFHSVTNYMGISGHVSSVDVFGDTAYFATNDSFWKYNYKTKESFFIDEDIAQMTGLDFYPIIVQNSNDIIMIGSGGYAAHFNGSNWIRDSSLFHFTRYGGDFNNNYIVVVGAYSRVGRGHRQ
ncbi:MAG: hypothetical protein HN994_03605 [Candidatus Marinimicrobia bacterium]|jgi:hypothetical protein|nr:hypothetical protein [Candidatus Neomarinimicrobiota bacterium]